MQLWLGEMDTGYWYLVIKISACTCLLEQQVDTKLSYTIETELKYFIKKILILDDGLPISKWIDGDHFYTNECWKFDAIKEGLSSLEWNHIKVGKKWKFMVRLLSWGNSITFTDWYYKDAGTACSSKREYILSPAIKVRLDFLEGNFQGVCKSKACEKWTVCHHYN